MDLWALVKRAMRLSLRVRLTGTPNLISSRGCVIEYKSNDLISFKFTFPVLCYADTELVLFKVTQSMDG